MGRYDARDLIGVPGLLSLSRIPLAVAFPFAVGRGRVGVALGVLAAAALTDMLDGWYARRFRQATALGSALDPATDKIFVMTVAITLVVTGHLSVAGVLLLSTREMGELPLVLWLAMSPGARVEHPAANVVGKTATALQFVSVSAALLDVRGQSVWVGMTAVVGAATAFTYWRRALRRVPRRLVTET